MKTNILTLICTVLALSACGTASQYASSQKYQDGFYSSHSKAEVQKEIAATKADIDKLVSQTESSRIFLKSGQADTLFIPENMSATLNFNKQNDGTSITVTNAPVYSLYPDSFAAGFAAGVNSSWPYWGSSWYWGSRYYWDAWYCNPWYSPWYSSWYWDDPWYWGRPYYGWAWYHDPWYHNPWYHNSWYYCCGGWIDPGFGPSYYGSRDTYWGARSYTEPRTRHSDGMGVTSSSVRRNTGSSSSRMTASNSSSGCE